MSPARSSGLLAWRGAWLALGLFFCVGAAANVPATGLDPSWVTGLHLAGDLRFGPELVFTYGPYAFLDEPLIMNRALFLLAVVAEIAVLVAVWAVVHRALSRRWTSWVTAPVSTLVVVVVAPAELSSLAVGVAAGALLLHVVPPEGRPPRTTRSTTLAGSGLATLGALVLQVKISDGVAVLALAAISVLAAASWRRRAVVLVTSLVSLTVATSVLWLLRGQSLRDFPTWLRRSLDTARGYGEALSLEAMTTDHGYYAAGAVSLLVVVAGTLLLRGRHRPTQVCVVLALGLVVAFAFKDGFTRHDTFHEQAFFVLTGMVLVVVAGISRHPAVALIGAAVALAMIRPDLVVPDPAPAADRWVANARVAFDPDYATDRLATIRTQLQGVYAMPDDIRDKVSNGVPVSIDPWETTVAWAYDLSWAPVPVFQTYAVVTESLDRLNAEAIVAAPPQQRILRRTEIPNDSRNPVWEAPRYQVAVACNYVTTAREEPWRVLEHRAPRCDDATELSVTRVAAGQVVEIPEVPSDMILTATFAPDEPGALSRLSSVVLKVYGHLMVSVDAGVHRVTRMPTTGPMMVRFPAVEEGAFDAFAYQTMGFNQPGQVTFATIRIR